MRRDEFVPKPAGFRFYHTHVPAGADLNRGTYTGLAGPVYIESKSDRGAYDREVFLVLKAFAPSFGRGGDIAMDVLAGEPVAELQPMGKADQVATEKTKGFEVCYNLFATNGHMLGHGEPVPVKQGEHVLFHVLNASATEIRSVALLWSHVPGDGARRQSRPGAPAEVPVLWLGTAERISAIVEMNHPGVRILGDLADDDRVQSQSARGEADAVPLGLRPLREGKSSGGSRRDDAVPSRQAQCGASAGSISGLSTAKPSRGGDEPELHSA
jgi:hypothetical protein